MPWTFLDWFYVHRQTPAFPPKIDAYVFNIMKRAILSPKNTAPQKRYAQRQPSGVHPPILTGISLISISYDSSHPTQMGA